MTAETSPIQPVAAARRAYGAQLGTQIVAGAATGVVEADALHPGYGWASNKGDGAKVHLEALRTLGPTPLHRRSFAPVAQATLL